jgi:hypothetical protein
VTDRSVLRSPVNWVIDWSGTFPLQGVVLWSCVPEGSAQGTLKLALTSRTSGGHSVGIVLGLKPRSYVVIVIGTTV